MSDTEPVVLMDKDLAAKTIEPLVTRVFDRIAAEIASEALEHLLPIDVTVTMTLRSRERLITRAGFRSQVEDLQILS